MNSITLLCLTLLLVSGHQVNGKTKQSPHPSLAESIRAQINPGDRDYGQAVHQFAAVGLGETLESAYFWVTILSLACSAVLCFMLFHLRQQRTRRELISSKLLAC